MEVMKKRRKGKGRREVRVKVKVRKRSVVGDAGPGSVARCLCVGQPPRSLGGRGERFDRDELQRGLKQNHGLVRAAEQ